jgi:membrane-bound metal-dependent hydrolase YbcI (DUF457 family)
MPYAVTHVLIPIILVDLVRDHLFKKKKKLLPNKFVILAGLAGLLPDIDIPISYLMRGTTEFHRTLTHSIWFPIAFFMLFLAFYYLKKKNMWKIFLMFFIGFSIHILLDFFIFGNVSLLFPLNTESYGLNIYPISIGQYSIYSAMDAILLFLWLIHEEFEHKISDYF